MVLDSSRVLVSAPERLAASTGATETSLPILDREKCLGRSAVFAEIATDKAHLALREKAGLLLFSKSSSNSTLPLATVNW